MRLGLWIASIVGAVVFSASAQAENVRFPASGTPAFAITTPGSWSHQPDGDGNMLLVAGDHTASFALTLGNYTGTLDELANAAMKSAGALPPKNTGPTQISGYRGYKYDTTMTNPAGLHVNVHMVVVKIDESHIASITMLSIDSIPPSDLADARSVLTNTNIVPGR